MHTMKEEFIMQYRYSVREEVLVSVGKDFSDENIYAQLQRLTSDEMNKLKSLFKAAELIEDSRGDNPFEDIA